MKIGVSCVISWRSWILQEVERRECFHEAQFHADFRVAGGCGVNEARTCTVMAGDKRYKPVVIGNRHMMKKEPS
jgi:hypothetical protein